MFVPTVVVPFFQTYMGAVLPLTGVAVNVTDVPAQIVVALADAETDGVKIGFTVIVTPVLVTGVVIAQVELLVISTVITSPFTKVLSV